MPTDYGLPRWIKSDQGIHVVPVGRTARGGLQAICGQAIEGNYVTYKSVPRKRPVAACKVCARAVGFVR